MARDYVAALPAELFPTMTGLADEFALADPDERFELLDRRSSSTAWPAARYPGKRHGAFD